MLVNTVQPTHRGATTLNATRRLSYNIAVIQQQLYTEYCFAPHNELVEYTLNSLFDSHIPLISSISSPISTTQCTALFIHFLPVFALKQNGSINRHDVDTLQNASPNHNINPYRQARDYTIISNTNPVLTGFWLEMHSCVTVCPDSRLGCLQPHWPADSLYIYMLCMNHWCTHNVTYDNLTIWVCIDVQGTDKSVDIWHWRR